MQHYRAPTRLLDWSASPYVAAYFAVEGRWEESDGALWAFRADLIANVAVQHHGADWEQKLIKDEFWSDPKASPELFAFRRGLDSDRMVAQEGCFTACRQPLCDHAQVIDETLSRLPESESAAKPYLKIIIAREAKPKFLHCLRSMNIGANSLFPGMDGIGLSVAEMLRMKEMSPAVALHEFVRRLPLN
jgi:hypothetical protein